MLASQPDLPGLPPDFAMLRYRCFQNCDPPKIASMWCDQPSRRGVARKVTTGLLEQLVFCKPYFDPEGLIVAENDHGIVGFAHAGFGPNEQYDDIEMELGVTCLLMVSPVADRESIADELMRRSEEYLHGRGAKVLYAGAIYPLNPFYLGLYGGSELPGVLQSDTVSLEVFSRFGYQEIDRCVILQRELKNFRPLVDRRHLKLKREYRIDIDSSALSANWWEACTNGCIERTRFEIRPVGRGSSCGGLSHWAVEPLGSSWGVHLAGLSQVEIVRGLRKLGLATYLNSEVLRQLQLAGANLVEAQTMKDNSTALALYHKLGFKTVDHGLVMRKQAR